MLLGQVVLHVLARQSTPAAPASPPFDGKIRPCSTDPARLDAYMVPPPCPEQVSSCKASSNHCASLVALPSGGIALSWFSGYREGWQYTGTALTMLSAPNESTWPVPQMVIPGIAGYSRQNPVLFADPGNSERLLIFGTQQPSRTLSSSEIRGDPVPNQESLGTMWFAESTDKGKHWDKPNSLDPYHGSWGRNPLLLGLDNSWLFPLYNESQKAQGHQYEHSAILRKPPTALVLPLQRWGRGSIPLRMNSSSYLVQPSIVRLHAGKPELRVFYRDRRAQWIYSAVSNDDGYSWSAPSKTTLPNNNAGIHAMVLSSGAVAVAYNNMSGETKGDLRNILAISLSDDGGQTFSVSRLLENHPSTHISNAHAQSGGVGPTSCNCYSYPTMVQTSDDTIHGV